MATTKKKNQTSPATEKKVVASKNLKARALKPGDKVAIVAPASRPEGPHVVAAAVQVLKEMGYVPVVGENLLAINGYMAGTDEERVADLNSFINDQSIRAIFCITGGYGSLRLLNAVDYDALVRDPKIIVGGDENTCLLNAIYGKTGLVCFHGPNLDRISTEAINNELKSVLTEVKLLQPILPVQSFPPGFVFSPKRGTASGVLLGGNLTALFSLVGTSYQPDFHDKILFLEDRNERNDVLERWFTSLILSGELDKVQAIVLGVFENCGPGNSLNLLSLVDIFEERLKQVEKPSCFGMAIGQTNQCRFVPIGVRANVDTNTGTIEFLEPALL